MNRSHTNRAYRLYDIFKKAAERKTSSPVLDAWSSILGIPSSNSDRRHAMEVQRMISLVGRELDRVEDELRAIGMDHEAYDDTIRSCRASLNPLNFNKKWNQSAKRCLDKSLPTVIVGWAQRLENEPVPVSEEDLDNFLEELTQVEEWARAELAGGPFRRYVLGMVGLMRQAVREYHIIGVEAFTHAVNEVYERTPYYSDLSSDDIGDEGRKILGAIKSCVEVMIRWSSHANTAFQLKEHIQEAIPHLLQAGS